MRGFVWLLLAPLGLVGACVVGIEDVESKNGGGAQGGNSGADASSGGAGGSGGDGGAAASGGVGGTAGGSVSVGGQTTGGGGGSVSGGGTGGTNPCPAGMLVVTAANVNFCIDQTEVSQADYQSFLEGPDLPQQDPCSGNNSLAPTCEFNPVTLGKRPVVCVDWCDARAYCTAKNKRLCGKVGGGTALPDQYINANYDEWYAACSAGGAQKYPYGGAHIGGKCNDISAPTTSPVDVGSYLQCVGGYPNLYDMSGNVREWEANCNGNSCYVRGGAYLDLVDNVACTSGILTTRTSATKELGFRCCADPS